jgi:hypothetical protein
MQMLFLGKKQLGLRPCKSFVVSTITGFIARYFGAKNILILAVLALKSLNYSQESVKTSQKLQFC